MNNAVFISAGMLQGRKFLTSVASLNLYLNFGCLGLATITNSAGVPSVLKHGRFSDPTGFAEEVATDGFLESTLPLFLSVPTYYALSWSRAFCDRIKEISPNKRIVAGGRWGLGEDPEWIRAKLPAVDQFIFGTAESRILSLVESPKRKLHFLTTAKSGGEGGGRIGIFAGFRLSFDAGLSRLSS